MIERVAVVGAGVIGSLYAAYLARRVDVSVLTRRPEHAEALSKRGLHISGKGDFTAEVRASADSADLPDFDLGIVATKATQLEEAVSQLEGRFPGATMMTIQNGLGAEEIVGRYGDWRLISAVTFMSGVRHSDTHVEYELDTETWMGPYAGTTTIEEVQDVERLLLDAGLRARAFPDLRPAQWSKLVFGAGVAAVSLLTDLPHVPQFAEEREFTDVGHVVRELIDEGKRVAEAAGIELYQDPWQMNLEAVRRGATGGGSYAHRGSVLVDLRAGRPTEVDFITGALIREAQRAGVPVPLNTALYRLIKAKEASR